MKKFLLIINFVLIMNMFAGCKNGKIFGVIEPPTKTSTSSSNSGKMTLAGVEYDADFIKSGYYFDRASFSEATLVDMLEHVEVINKPSNLGEVILPDFSSYTLTKNKIPDLTDADIEEEIEKIRDKETTYTQVKTKRAAKMTDKVLIDYKGMMNGKEFEGGSATDYELVLGSNAFIPGFETQVAGHEAGEPFNIKVTFPDGYGDLGGKEATFEITIKSIEEAVTPEIDDKFAVSHSAEGATTLEAYKEEVKKNLIKKNEFLNNQDLVYQIAENINNDAKFSPTEKALAWKFSVTINEIVKTATSQGTNLATLIAQNGSTAKETYDELKAYIPEYIKSDMLVDELNKKYKVNMTEKDVKDWFTTMASAMGYGDEISYDDYVSYIGYDAMLSSAKEERLLLSAANECKIVEGDDTAVDESTD